MNILFIHPNFPAQFRHMAQWFGSHGHRVVFATENDYPEWKISGVTKAVYTTQPLVPAKPGLFQPLLNAASHAEAFFNLGEGLLRQGFVPDVICGASGWGGTWFARDLFPKARLVGYFEWYYNPDSADALFDARQPLAASRRAGLRLRNTLIVNDLLTCDVCITPTEWQRHQFPEVLRNRLITLHDGIDTQFFTPESEPSLAIAGLPLSGRETIITYATRGMEPYRGFPQFIESLPRILENIPTCHIVIAGDDRVCYGSPRADGLSWKQAMLAKVPLPPDRVHFVGRLPYGQYRQLLRCSTVHVYLTRPFVLSWSMLEAMACGCLVVASDTEPVRELIEDEVNGLLFDFQSPDQLARRVIDAVRHGDAMGGVRRAARETIRRRYDLQMMLERQVAILCR